MADLMFWWGHFALAAIWCALLYFAAQRAAVRARSADGSPWSNVALSSGFDDDGGEGPPSGPRLALSPAQQKARKALTGEILQAAILRWLYMLAVPRQDRDDLRADVNEAALRSIHTFDPERGRLERWLNAIAVHVAAHWHDRARHRREELHESPVEVEDLEASPTMQLEREEERLVVQVALAALPASQREILQAYDIEGEHMGKIAVRLGMALSTAYHARERALTTLAELLRATRG